MIPKTLNQVIANLKEANTHIHFLEDQKLVSIDYFQLRNLIIGNVEHFNSLGIRQGDRVLISLKTDLEHIVAFLSSIAMGAIPVSIKPARTSNDIYVRYIADLCDRFRIHYGYHTLPLPSTLTSVAWCLGASSTNLVAIAKSEPEDLAFVQFSSGSTSLPKAIPISHKNLMTNLSTILNVDGRKTSSVGFNFLPLSHDMGLIGGLLSNLVYQNSLLLANTSEFLRRPIDSLEIANRFNVNVLAMPDFALRYIDKYLSISRSKKLDQHLLTNIQTIYCGAEPIKIQTITSFLQTAEKFGLEPSSLFFSYGLAEGTLMVTGRRFSNIEDSFYVNSHSRSAARVGSPLGGTEVSIWIEEVDGKEYIADEGQVGIVKIRGLSVFDGYWEDVPRLKDDWFNTGDLGFIRNGDLYICGRNKDMLIVNGENIFAVDIENHLGKFPELKDSLMIVDEDLFYILAVTSKNTKLDLQKITSSVCENFGVSPKAITQVLPDCIVRTTSGKPIRSETLKKLREKGLLTN